MGTHAIAKGTALSRSLPTQFPQGPFWEVPPSSRLPLHPGFKGSPGAQLGVTHLPGRAGAGSHPVLALLPMLPAPLLPEFPPSPIWISSGCWR